MRIRNWTRALLAGALLAGSAAGAAEPPAPVLGIDVSHYSGAVDWQAVRAAGYAFAYVKATEGVDSAD
ncbi:MAG TPA: GH25 family lysozyme, partial [Thermoanaerobaculia bacterium]|nr:GH25 family lysozyme [Thermoanaerobaculia bacterium]